MTIRGLRLLLYITSNEPTKNVIQKSFLTSWDTDEFTKAKPVRLELNQLLKSALSPDRLRLKLQKLG